MSKCYSKYFSNYHKITKIKYSVLLKLNHQIPICTQCIFDIFLITEKKT